jgi:hypothetical protein
MVKEKDTLVFVGPRAVPVILEQGCAISGRHFGVEELFHMFNSY